MVDRAGGALAGNETWAYTQNVKAWHFLALFIVVFVWYCNLQQLQWHLQRNAKLFQAGGTGIYSTKTNILLAALCYLHTAKCSVIIINSYYVILTMHWLICVHNWSTVYRARSPQMMIIAACLSHASATFSLAVMHLTRQFSSRQRDWQGHNEAWQEHTSPGSCEGGGGRKRQSICLIWTRCAPGRSRCAGSSGAGENREETKRKAFPSGGPCQAIGLNIIRKKGVSPELMPPSVHLWHTGLCPLTSGCTSERFTRLV